MKKALLLVNVGTPENCDEESVGRYLREFLNDPFVIDWPQPLRWLLVNGIIVPKRKRKSQAAYKKIWRDNGSPLLSISRSFKEKLANELSEFNISLAMRYGQPSLRDEMQKVVGQNPSAIYLWPQYPQYARSSTETAKNEVLRLAREMRFSGRLFVIEEFAENKDVAALWAKNILQAAEGFGAQKLVLSYHGLPISHLRKISKNCKGEGECSLVLTGENKMCYRRQAFATSKEICTHLFRERHEEMALSSQEVEVSFQSRLTSGWIKPFSDELYQRLPAQGVKRILVACPSFVTDCLETLEEVAIRERERFIACGGEDLRLVPCLNDSPEWVQLSAQIVRAEKNWVPIGETAP